MSDTAYTLAIREELSAQRDLAEEHKRHAAAVKDLESKIADALRRIALANDGLDLERILLAEHVIRVHGWERRGDEGASAVADAIREIATGGKRLRSEFFGAKNYDRWWGQRCDCSYGMGPSHGSIVMSVGLTPEARTRDLTPEEVDAALYYLKNIDRIEAARREKK